MNKFEKVMDTIWDIFWNVYFIWACISLSAKVILSSFEIDIPHFGEFQLGIVMLSMFIYALKCRIVNEIKKLINNK